MSGKTRIEVDPGERKIRVTAPGRASYATTIVLAKKDDKTIDIPALGKAGGNPRRTFGKIAVFSGAGLFAASIGVALIAKSRQDGANCMKDPNGGPDLICATADDLSKFDGAKTLGNVGTVIGTVGVVGAVVGTVLWLTAPAERTDRPRAARLDVFGDGNSAGVALRGRF
jgi:TctA family transporter